ncbi:SDR family NAD(P)-dependent oxidoreductase [Amycolatopsis nigrescens]|uniref:SDR family NAD(P)-dependent oxidoreductase n=1 Tax=Amycolatopsis nigrescens TaxID=381445 RepID=UPI0003663E59|nr:glucose 1-dehydrogenase [Amycolatopsis nigrescens]
MSTARPLTGRVAIVTGASRDIGAATAKAFGQAGATVVLAARGEQQLAAVTEEITAAGGRALAVPTDVADPASVRRLVEQTLGAYGRLDAAVNNAAAARHRPTPLAELSIEEYDEAVAVNLRGVFLSMKYEIPAMLDSGGGAIVNMSSTGGLEAVAGIAGYVSTKFGVVGLTRTAALDYAGAGVRVNALAPGPIFTAALRQAGEQAREHVAHGLPMRRIGSPEEVAAAAVWLCSEASSFVTGVTLPVDGGKLAGMAP